MLNGELVGARGSLLEWSRSNGKVRELCKVGAENCPGAAFVQGTEFRDFGMETLDMKFSSTWGESFGVLVVFLLFVFAVDVGFPSGSLVDSISLYTLRSFVGLGEERTGRKVGAGEAGGAGGGRNANDAVVPSDGAVIGRAGSEAMYLGFLADENILASPRRSFPDLPRLF